MREASSRRIKRRTNFLTDDGIFEALTLLASRKVEAFAPTVFVEIGNEGVELVHKVRGRQDSRADALAILLIEELVVRVDAAIDQISRHGSRLAPEGVKRILAEPRQLDGDIYATGRCHAADDELDPLIVERVHEAFVHPFLRNKKRRRDALVAIFRFRRVRELSRGRAMGSIVRGRFHRSMGGFSTSVET